MYAQGIRRSADGKPVLPHSHTPRSPRSLQPSTSCRRPRQPRWRAKRSAAVRNDKRKALIGLLQQVRAYIQATADATNAVSVIQSAGVAVRKTPTRHARIFAAKPGRVSGVATVVATSAARRASVAAYVHRGGPVGHLL